MELDIENPFQCVNRVVEYRRGVFDELEEKRPNSIWLKVSLRNIKKVVIINSSSRSGSSLLYSILKKIPGMYSLSAEGVPFYKLNGLSLGSFSSDEITQDTIIQADAFSDLSRDFLSDISMPCRQDRILENGALLEEYIDDLALRFPLQWPQISFSYEQFKNLAFKALESYKNRHKDFCKEEFYLELFSFLRKEYKEINPYYYDIPSRMVKERFPELEIPSGPPNNILTIEEPPFIVLEPGIKASETDFFQKTLILKSSVDSYRMEFLESFFPEAEIKIIYLVRNPLGCINGLCDGWLHRGFFSYNLRFSLSQGIALPKMLKICGYSEQNEWGKWWWNYDLPPGWQDYIENPLEEVCAFQWYSSNKAIQKYLGNQTKRHCFIRYENIIKGLGARRQEIEKIVDFVGASTDCIGQLELDRLPVIQATDQPRPFRWKKRQDQLLPLLEKSQIREMSAQLGYDKIKTGEWF